MIAGNKPSPFPYRTAGQLTSFFTDLNLDYYHDGSTRATWVEGVLTEINDAASPNSDTLAPQLIQVIEYLVHPDHFVWSKDIHIDHNSAISLLNEMLREYDMEVCLLGRKSLPQIVNLASVTPSSHEVYMESTRHIVFVPQIFKIPEKDVDSQLVSVMMPFGAELNRVYSEIKTQCSIRGLDCYRADDIWNNPTIIQDIFELIFCARLVIVDLTDRNPNVLYETGIAHTLGKDVIPIAQHKSHIPSNIGAIRTLHYHNNMEGIRTMGKDLGSRIDTLLGL